MCGRFTLRNSPAEIAEHFRLDPADLPDLRPRFNIAPTQPVAAVAPSSKEEGRSLALLRWGLVPPWVDDPADFPTLINARAETAPEKPAFREAFRDRRCLVPADGFYEWTEPEDGGPKRPYYVSRPDGGLFSFAGLWERWSGEGGRTIDSCTILTTDPNEVVGPLHDRMPVILDRAHYEAWLDPGGSRSQLEALLRPAPAGTLRAVPVSRRVNSPENDDPACIEPVAG